MCKSSHNLTMLDFFRRRTFLCLFDNRRKIFFFSDSTWNMGASRIGSCSCRVHTVLVAVLWRHDTVCRHQNRTVEALKFFFLFPPCISIVSDKVRIFLEGRIVMCRKHLRMCVNIHTCPLCLFQKHLQITKIMPGNKDSWIFANPNVDFCDLRISISLCIGFVQKFHHLHTVTSGLQCQCSQLICTQGIIQSRCKCPLQKCVNLHICMCKCRCMFCISSQSFQPVSDQFTKAADIFILCRKNSHARSFCFKIRFRSFPECCFRKYFSIFHFPDQFFFCRQCIFNSFNDRIFIKIRIGDRRKQIHYDHLIYIGLNLFSIETKLRSHCA